MPPKRPSSDDVPQPVDRRKNRILNSCYPCRQRKVRCDQQRPCSNCIKRDHVGDCMSTPRRAAASSQIQDLLNPPTQQTENGDVNGQVGAGDVASTPRGSDATIETPSSHVHEDVIRPAIEGDASQRPTLIGPEAISDFQTLEISRYDIVRIWRSYIWRAHLLSPILDNPEEVESWVARLVSPSILSEGSSSSLATTTPSSSSGSAPSSILTAVFDSGPPSPFTKMVAANLPELPLASVALLHAVLAAGVQYSELPATRRSELVRMLCTRSYQAMRASNYLRRPTATVLKGLVLIGHVMQNDRACEAAWALAGTTIRLGQCMGIHTGLWPHSFADTATGRDAAPKAQLLHKLAWHDGLLSMCLGRIPAVILRQTPDIPPGRSISQVDFMTLMTSRITDHASQEHPLPELLAAVHDARAFFTTLLARHEASLPPQRTLNSTIALINMRLHHNFATSYLCRPCLRVPTGPLTPTERAARLQLLEITKTCLVAAMQHYLELVGVADFATRSWSVAHSGLGAALLLGTLGEFRRPDGAIRGTGGGSGGGSGSGSGEGTLAQHLAGQVIETLEHRDPADAGNIVARNSRALTLLKRLYDESTGELGVDPRPAALRVSPVPTSGWEAANRASNQASPQQYQPQQQHQQQQASKAQDAIPPTMGLGPGSPASAANNGYDMLPAIDPSNPPQSFTYPTALEEFDQLFADFSPEAWSMFDAPMAGEYGWSI